ncbi:cell envelope integrity protein TolA [Paracoccus denitrificans]|jgi:colicin import membrane protein|uniref:Cell division and transport-associated protein TolA n=1 Tax=Paracoccus denitrificans (strain Pd 1222) TaxID=318586 RepID=A1AZV3_PARDP|nr:cell envelope integrity protein TolA [Paracoccus denitrificans]ABL68797.1 Cell division and transport-associated protein TolA [Paracoccus denitrificans PD1222]MBB4625477.1 colicin import membrane protein [Paracoccus denitrificans]QAR26846.1 cell envelope integrity protein TolA [Paracoccus denitrificans]UPV95803.1 cell envelope integrity protein TolA [Paracoccus denitrificans]WQO32130.1 cell envelope integrity protein TolA [Paracoccus denitrificans]
MDRAERIGFWVSGFAHAGLLGAALVGGALFRPQPLEAVRMAEVATMSEAEFQSLAAAAAGRGPVSDVAATTPAQPRPPADENRLGEVEAVSPPAPDAQAAELSTPSDRPEARPDLSDFQTPNRPVAVATDAPRPAEPENTVELAALPQSSDRPDPARNPAQPQSPAPIPQRSALAPVESSRPRGRPEGLAEAVQARRAAADAARQREQLLARQEAEAAAERAAAAKADEAAARRAAEERAREERREAERSRADAEAARKAEEAEARARRQAAAQAAEKTAAEEAAAEKRAAERKAEAERRAAAEKAATEKAAAEKAAAEKAAAEKAEAERKAAEAKARKEAEEKAAAEKAAAEKKAAEKAAAEAKAREQAEAERKAAEAAKQAALKEAMQDQGSAGSGGGGAAASGPPLSQGEKDGFRVAVEQCWNRGSLSTEASRTTVSVQFSMAPDGTVEKGSLRMIGHDGGSDAAAKQAYEAARRAILMCEKGGYKLPPEKYNRWKDVIIDFNASGGARVK